MLRHATCLLFTETKNVSPDHHRPVWLLPCLQAFPAPSSKLCHQQVVIWPLVGSSETCRGHVGTGGLGLRVRHTFTPFSDINLYVSATQIIQIIIIQAKLQ